MLKSVDDVDLKEDERHLLQNKKRVAAGIAKKRKQVRNTKREAKDLELTLARKGKKFTDESIVEDTNRVFNISSRMSSTREHPQKRKNRERRRRKAAEKALSLEPEITIQPRIDNPYLVVSEFATVPKNLEYTPTPSDIHHLTPSQKRYLVNYLDKNPSVSRKQGIRHVEILDDDYIDAIMLIGSIEIEAGRASYPPTKRAVQPIQIKRSFVDYDSDGSPSPHSCGASDNSYSEYKEDFAYEKLEQFYREIALVPDYLVSIGFNYAAYKHFLKNIGYYPEYDLPAIARISIRTYIQELTYDTAKLYNDLRVLQQAGEVNALIDGDEFLRYMRETIMEAVDQWANFTPIPAIDTDYLSLPGSRPRSIIYAESGPLSPLPEGAIVQEPSESDEDDENDSDDPTRVTEESIQEAQAHISYLRWRARGCVSDDEMKYELSDTDEDQYEEYPDSEYDSELDDWVVPTGTNRPKNVHGIHKSQSTGPSNILIHEGLDHQRTEDFPPVPRERSFGVFDAESESREDEGPNRVGFDSWVAGPSDTLDSFMAYLNRYREMFSVGLHNVLDAIGPWLAFIYQAYRSTNAADYLAAGYQFCKATGLVDKINMPDLDIWKYIHTESFSDKMISFKSFLMSVFDSNILSTLKKLLMQAVSYKLFDKDIATDLMSWFGKPSKMTLFELLSESYDALVLLIKVGESLVAGVPMSEVLLSKDPVYALNLQVSTLLYYADKLFHGIPIPGYISVTEFVTKAEVIQQTFEQIKKALANTESAKELNKNMLKLKSVMFDVTVRYANVPRMMPFGIIVTGPPGIGKSSMIEYLASLWSKLMGRDFQASHIYHKNTNSIFWENYQPLSQPIIHFSELGALRPEMVKMKGDPSLQEVTTLMDPLPYSVNMPFEDKGKVYAMPELILIDNNDPEMNLRVIVKNPAAYRRRFIYIFLRVKPEFLKANTSMLDVEKALASDSAFYDRWLCTVYRMEAKDNYNSEKIVLCEDVDIYAMTEVLRNEMTNHIVKQLEIKDRKEHSIDPLEYFQRPITAEAGSIKKDRAPILSTMAGSLYRAPKPFLFYLATLVASLAAFVNNILPFEARIFAMVLMYILYFLRLHFLIDLAIAVLFPVFLISLLESKYIEERLIEFLSRRLTLAKTRLIDYAKGQTTHLFQSSFYLKYKYHLAMGSILFVSLMMLMRKRVKVQTQAAATVIKSKRENIWNVKQVELKQGPHVSDIESLWNHIQNNIRYVCVNGVTKTFLFGIQGEYAVINTHAVPDGAELAIANPGQEINESTVYQKFTLTHRDIIRLDNDISVVRCSGVFFKNVTKHILENDFVPTSYDAMTFDKRVKALYVVGGYDLREPNGTRIPIKGMFQYKHESHTQGDCGTPLLVTKGNSSVIAGFHAGGERIFGYAVVFSSTQINSAIQSLKASSRLVPLVEIGEITTESLGQPNPKSFVHYENLGNLLYFGKEAGPVNVHQKSKLIKDSLGEVTLPILSEYGDIAEFGRPLMAPRGSGENYVSPWNLAIRNMAMQRPGLNRNIIEKIISELTRRFTKDLPSMTPWTTQQAINGQIGNSFMRRINVRTSSGYRFGGTKEAFLPIEQDEPLIRGMAEHTKEQLDILLQSCYNAAPQACVYQANLKDEPRLIEKCRAGKTRVFFAGPLDHLILSRQYLGPFYTLMQQYDTFCTAIGIDMHRDASEIIDALWHEDRIIEGDYSRFDQSIPFEIRWAVFSIIYNVLKNKGYTETDLRVVQSLITTKLFPCFTMMKEVLMCPGLQPSGDYGTAENNSLVNLVLMMYMWYVNHDTPFFKSVQIITYGDDLLAAVDHNVTDFDCFIIKDLAKQHLGMDFTPATKGETVNRFESHDTMSFLKRTFVYDKEHKHWKAPLDISSIQRMVTWYIPSKSVPYNFQISSCLTSFAYETAIALPRHAYDLLQREITEWGIRNEIITPSLTYDEIWNNILYSPDDDHGLTVNCGDGVEELWGATLNL